MEDEPANHLFCQRALNPHEQLSTFLNGPWTGQQRNHGVNISVVRKVQTFLQSRPAVLHLDELINKKDPLQVRYLMMRLIEERAPVPLSCISSWSSSPLFSLFGLVVDVVFVVGLILAFGVRRSLTSFMR